jgi:hypothetical protein
METCTFALSLAVWQVPYLESAVSYGMWCTYVEKMCIYLRSIAFDEVKSRKNNCFFKEPGLNFLRIRNGLRFFQESLYLIYIYIYIYI